MADNIIKTEERCGHVTFQMRLYLGGHLFKINSQYKFDRVVYLEIGCGCTGNKKSVVKHYGVCVGPNVFLVEARYVVETNVAIPEVSQDFDTARRDQHRNAGIADYDPIRVNQDPKSIWQKAGEQSTDRLKH